MHSFRFQLSVKTYHEKSPPFGGAVFVVSQVDCRWNMLERDIVKFASKLQDLGFSYKDSFAANILLDVENDFAS